MALFQSPATVNMSNPTNIFVYLNNVTDSWISNMILIAIWIMVLVGFYKSSDDFSGAMAVAGFGVFIIALLFWMGGFVSGMFLSITMGLAIIGLLVHWIS
jgi:hypothetical protein